MTLKRKVGVEDLGKMKYKTMPGFKIRWYYTKIGPSWEIVPAEVEKVSKFYNESSSKHLTRTFVRKWLHNNVGF